MAPLKAQKTNKFSKNFSLVFHLLSMILLVACLCSVIILFRQLRQLEALVGEKNGPKTQDAGMLIFTGYDDKNRPRKRAAAAFDSFINLNGKKVPITGKDETEDGSWAIMPSMTKIPVSTMQDFCFTIHQFCANKDQAIRPAADRGRSEGTDCDGRCSSRRSNNELSDIDTPQELPSEQDPLHGVSGGNEGRSSNVYSSEDSLYPVASTHVLPPITKRRKGLGRKKRRREKCYIQQISAPFLMGQHRTFYGSWLQDASPREDFDADKRWLTEHVTGQFLFEYGSVFDLKRGGTHGDAPVKTYQLPYMYDGTNHLIYNGSVLYQRVSSPTIIRYDLRSGNWTETTITGAACKGGDYLYSGTSYNYFDLASDENGIWVFFHYEKSKTLSVARLHPKTTRIIRTWNLTRFDHTQIGDIWVTCGVMYVLDSRTSSSTSVSIAYDLFRHRSANVSMPWRNTYNKTSMLAYNPLVKKLHIFDNGYLLERNLLIAYPGKQENYY